MATITRVRTVRFCRVLAVVVWLTVAVPSAAADVGPVVYRPPVDAPVVDGFRPPERPYGPGNRGLTYDLAPGTDVRAAADGTVAFAGTVAGELHVTIAHADGLRSSYSFLDRIDVARGQRVDAGDVVGGGTRAFHFGVRDGDVYLDPAALFGAVEVRVRLVDGDPPPPSASELAADRRELRRLRVPGAWILGQIDDVIDTTKRELRHLAARVVDATRIRFDAWLDVTSRFSVRGMADMVNHIFGRMNQPCTAPDVTVAVPSAQRRVAVTVAGYGSDSASAAVDDVDTRALGYADGDVVRFSYLGGRVPGPVSADLATIPEHPYTPVNTFADLRQRGIALADLLVAVADARPGEPVDVYAHSQGGIVTRLALAELQRRGRLDVLGSVVTIGSPHRGADLASAGVALAPWADQIIEWAAAQIGASVDPDATSIHQMAEGSALLDDLAAAGVPDGVQFRTIGARGDLIVPASRTTVDGAPAAYVDLVGPSAHDSLPGDADTTRELVLALAGKPPGCEGVGDIILDTVFPVAVTTVEDLLTLTVPIG